MNATLTDAQRADCVVKLIAIDVKIGVVPPTITAFRELHDHVDANEYLLCVGLTGREEEDETLARILAHVDEAIAAGRHL